ncbi:hypothetical protein CWO92_10930 [Heyndrickxia camelliae]|uniref:Uncharacterized protein n=1 Tax=Heyndrickxia camelliae TaxID=1707093 RepID=A0A2N3LJT4_9BACI|nr:hypothetical protein CWO92_10930 [Heyndrickxia camelliae]
MIIHLLIRGKAVKVKIIDTRPKWMRQEDEQFKCRTFCDEYRKCYTRCGSNCRKFGGDVIPKIRR